VYVTNKLIARWNDYGVSLYIKSVEVVIVCVNSVKHINRWSYHCTSGS